MNGFPSSCGVFSHAVAFVARRRRALSAHPLIHSPPQGAANAKDESKATLVLDELRSLPSKHALSLRTKVADASAALRTIRGGVDDALRKAFRAGVEI